MKLKYALILALGFALGHVSYSAMQASIQTPTPLTLGNPMAGTSETDNSYAVVASCVNYQTSEADFVLQAGNATVTNGSTTAFQIGPVAAQMLPQMVIQFNPYKGTWSTSGFAGQTGQLTSDQIANIMALENASATHVTTPVETTAVNLGLFPNGSTQYPAATGETISQEFVVPKNQNAGGIY